MLPSHHHASFTFSLSLNGMVHPQIFREQARPILGEKTPQNGSNMFCYPFGTFLGKSIFRPKSVSEGSLGTSKSPLWRTRETDALCAISHIMRTRCPNGISKSPFRNEGNVVYKRMSAPWILEDDPYHPPNPGDICANNLGRRRDPQGTELQVGPLSNRFRKHQQLWVRQHDAT